MTARVCSRSGCATLVPAGVRGGRCQAHRREADADRGSRAERGYGPEHQAERQHWQDRIDAGELVLCWRCQDLATPITDRAWHLGHDDHDRTITRGPEHESCNLRAAGKARQA